MLADINLLGLKSCTYPRMAPLAWTASLAQQINVNYHRSKSILARNYYYVFIYCTTRQTKTEPTQVGPRISVEIRWSLGVTWEFRGTHREAAEAVHCDTTLIVLALGANAARAPVEAVLRRKTRVVKEA